MSVIEKSKLLNLINEEFAKLPDYDESIKATNVAINSNTGELEVYPNVTDSRVFDFKYYLEEVTHKLDRYSKII